MSVTRIIVFPLNESSPKSDFAWIGEGIALSLSSQIAGRAVKTMGLSERDEVVEALDLPPRAALSRGSMIRVAQRASADLIVIGSYAGTEQNLRVSVQVLDVKSLKLSGEMIANGPLSVLPQLENELAWMILTNMSLERVATREEFQERTRSVPNSAYALFIQSLSIIDDNKKLRLLLKAVDEHNDFPKAHLQIGRLYYQKDTYDRALLHLSQGYPGNEMSREDAFMLGTCYLMTSQPVEAIRIYEQMLQVSRTFEVLNNIGVAYYRKGNPILGLNALMEAKQLAQKNAAILLNLALARHLQGNDQAALLVLEGAVQLNPKSGMLQYMLGYLLKIKGEDGKAAAANERAKSLGVDFLKLKADDPKSWFRPILILSARTNSFFR
jgi:tetratricopeptide (TPR) repeat protein